tara:strand:- start:194 stop:412 length:219 start_codon:yes stop_codon:yes gene_type:complete
LVGRRTRSPSFLFFFALEVDNAQELLNIAYMYLVGEKEYKCFDYTFYLFAVLLGVGGDLVNWINQTLSIIYL